MDEEYDIDKQLDAATNLRYANRHLNWLEKRLAHPLFIAYAYNGGIGFTNRMLKSGIFKKGKYEPYLSMELVPYDESKRYGKKVLANYVMYYNHTHKAKISVTSLLQNLTKPHQ
jgi:soluble lytic murein transglycosylase